MSRKSLFFGSIVLILAMLFALSGCKDPVAGPAGPQGDTGPDGPQGNTVQGPTGPTGSGGLSGDNITAVDLVEAFETSKTGVVTLFSNVGSVYGVVPPGKTLKVLGDYVAVPTGRSLVLREGATLIINGGAVLSASAVSGEQGFLIAKSGTKVEGDGAVVLPVDLTADTSYTDSLHWESAQVTVPDANKYPGSYYGIPTNAVPLTPPKVHSLDSDAIARIFTSKGKDVLTVQNVETLAQNAIPAGKKLTLMGTKNAIPAAGEFLLNQNTRLTLAAGGELTIGGTSVTVEFKSNADAIFTNEGTISLGGDSSIIANGGTVTNNGVIKTATGDVGVIVPLLAFGGTGTVKLNPPAGSTLDFTSTTDIPLNQYLELGGGTELSEIVYQLPDPPHKKPFTGIAANRTLTIGQYAVVELEVGVEAIGTTVYNSGTIKTATKSTSVLSTIFTETGNRGKVEATGAVEDDHTKSTDVFTIPAGITLELSGTGANAPTLTTSAPLITPKLVIAGTLSVSGTGVELKPSGDITITGNVYLRKASATPHPSLTIADGRTLDISSSAVFDDGKDDDELGSLLAAGGVGPKAIIINGETGYSLSNGVVGSDYAKAIDAINATRNILTDKIPLAPTGTASTPNWSFPGVEKVVGTAVITLKENSDHHFFPVFATNTGTGTQITLPAGTTLDTTILVALNNQFTVANDFVLKADDASKTDSGGQGGVAWGLILGDTEYAASDKVDILRFNGYQIEHSNLKTPMTNKFFHIGVKSAR
jgi:hypothetical protein